MVWTSHIKSFDDIAPHLRFLLCSQNILSQLAAALSSYENVTFEELFHRFLKGTGVPCPKLFENARNHFTSIIDLSKIDDLGFRPRIFYWAATGSPSIEINGPGVSVSAFILSFNTANNSYKTSRFHYVVHLMQIMHPHLSGTS
jgi:hypothetical protein